MKFNKKFIKGSMISLTALFVFTLFLFQSAFSQVSLNKVDLDSAINPNSFSFIVTGHIHGSSANQSGYPASTFLGNIDWIQETLQPSFIWFTGDVFQDIKKDYPFYQHSLFSKVAIPMYNAVGNHDLSGDFYQENIGETYFAFTLGTNLFITLDAETDDSQITGQQLEFFISELEQAKEEGVKNVFITSHRPIWAETNPEFQGLFSDNTRSLMGDNFVEDILPELEKYQRDYAIYWFSGSMGNVPVSFFYHKEENSNITYIQTAIRNIQRDAILEVSIVNNQVSFTPHSLTGQDLEPLEYYNMDFWKDYKKPIVEFNYRLIPLYIKQTLTSRMFWYGMGGMVMIFFIGGLFLREFNRRTR